jgi:hypothetical protein
LIERRNFQNAELNCLQLDEMCRTFGVKYFMKLSCDCLENFFWLIIVNTSNAELSILLKKIEIEWRGW